MNLVKFAGNLKLLLIIILFAGCEEPFEPDFANQDPVFVVEGYLDANQNELPPYVTISKTYPLFNDNHTNFELYLGGAKVYVSSNGEEFILNEFCLKDLTPEQREQISQLLQLDSSLMNLDLCFYVDVFRQIKVNPGSKYDLKILIDSKELNASTTIPNFVPLDSFKTESVENYEKYRTLWAYLTDPIETNFYRTKLAVNGGQYQNSSGRTVSDDIFYNGTSFDFPLFKPHDHEQENDPNTIGLFSIGDTVSVRHSTLDKEHFDFWNTLEFAQANQGPFSTYSRAKSNIDGGIGIWGGYNTKTYEIIIE